MDKQEFERKIKHIETLYNLGLMTKKEKRIAKEELLIKFDMANNQEVLDSKVEFYGDVKDSDLTFYTDEIDTEVKFYDDEYGNSINAHKKVSDDKKIKIVIFVFVAVIVLNLFLYLTILNVTHR